MRMPDLVADNRIRARACREPRRLARPCRRRRVLPGALAALAVCLSAAAPQAVRAQGLREPDCAGLEGWAAKRTAGETVSLAPKVQVGALLRDDLVVPLFGKPVGAWDAKETAAVRRALSQCRKAANKRKDRAASDRLALAQRELDGSRRALSQMQQARASAPRQVQWLLDQHPSPQLPGQLALAQDALEGKPVDPRRHGLTQRPGWASQLQHAASYLPSAETAPLVARLAERRAQLEAEGKAAVDALAAAREALAKAPANAEGLATIDRLQKDPALEKLPATQADAFRNELQQRRWAIQRSMRQDRQHQAAVAAAQPVSVGDRLAAILVGDEVDEVSIRGLRPGIEYADAKRMVARDWRFGSGAGGDLMKDFTPTRRDLDRYTQAERRDGGRFVFQTMHGKVGQIKFIENYTGPMDVGRVYAGLEKRFGKPEKRETDSAAVLARWKDGRSYLQVFAGNRVSGPRSTRTYRSSVVVQLWNRGYMDYLIEAKKRCDELEQKPMSQLSVRDKQALLAGCKSP